MGHITVAFAVDHGNLLHNIFRLHTQNRCDLSSNPVAAGNTFVGLCLFTGCQGCSIPVAACITAGTAVGTWKTFPDTAFCFIYRHCHDLGGNSQYNAADQADDCHRNDC